LTSYECDFLGLINTSMFYLYCLKQNQEVKYFGITINPKKRKNDHKRKKPPHIFEVLESFDTAKEATNREEELIEIYKTTQIGWNISPGGEYDGNSGYCRKGIGGAKKGRVPWNAGKKGCFSEDTIKQMIEVRRGRIFSSKFTTSIIVSIRERFENHQQMDGVGTVQPNGMRLTQERAFAKEYSKHYGMTTTNLFNIVTGKSWLNTN